MPNWFTKPFPWFQYLCFPQKCHPLDPSSGSWGHESNSTARKVLVLGLLGEFAELCG